MRSVVAGQVNSPVQGRTHVRIAAEVLVEEGRLFQGMDVAGIELECAFELLRGLLVYLPKQSVQPQTIFAFELKLLRELGLTPDLAKARLTPGAKQIVTALSASDWTAVARLKLSEAQLTELRRFQRSRSMPHETATSLRSP